MSSFRAIPWTVCHFFCVFCSQSLDLVRHFLRWLPYRRTDESQSRNYLQNHLLHLSLAGILQHYHTPPCRPVSESSLTLQSTTKCNNYRLGERAHSGNLSFKGNKTWVFVPCGSGIVSFDCQSMTRIQAPADAEFFPLPQIGLFLACDTHAQLRKIRDGD